MWAVRDNTDGSVIQSFPLPGSWEVHVNARFDSGITTWRWVDEPASFTPLTMGTEVVLRAYPTPSMCRRDCTVPRCGDGLVDGGEVCDDGNVRNGDLCSSDCLRVPG